MNKPTLCSECNGTGRRGLQVVGGVRAHRTCEACNGTGKVEAGAEQPTEDPRVRHTARDEARRRKHGGER